MARTDWNRLEQLALAAFAAVPLYFSYVLPVVSVVAFHLALLAIGIAAMVGRPIRIPAPLLAATGVLYLLFFPFDVLVLSRGLIAPSSHLLFFIIVYQAIESEWRSNAGQRLFVTFLVFVTASATSTHSSIVLYMVGFLFLAYRQMILQAHVRTREALEKDVVASRRFPLTKNAAVLALATVVIAFVMFPFLPRVRDPFVKGVASLSAAQSTGITDTIDFDEERIGSDDPEVIARVWTDPQEIIFTPIRLRAAVYDTWLDGRWISSKRHTYQIRARRGNVRLANPEGQTGSIVVQQRRTSDRRVYAPSGTWAISGLREVIFSQFDGVPMSTDFERGPLTFTAEVSLRTRPIAQLESGYAGYPESAEIRALAEQIVGSERDPIRASRRIENYLATRFTYLSAGTGEMKKMSVDDFLLRVRKGHCEYFAAGMVVLLESIGIPSRIVGGFYGGELNKLGGYWIIRVRDAHAWVEVEADGRWNTFDPTPEDLRPGSGAGSGLLTWAAMAAESLSYFWDRWILTYGASDQVSLAERMADSVRGWIDSVGKGFSLAWVARWLPIGLAAAGFVVILLMLRFRGRRTLWEQTLAELGRLGIRIEESETEGEILARVHATAVDLVPVVGPIVRFQQVEKYSSRSPDQDMTESARRGLLRLKALNAVSGSA